MSPMRILVVEDFAAFRDFICSTLGRVPDLQIVGVVSDGLDAVRQAEALKPDLILLDIGLPTLNGMAAARQIRKLAPDSKIIFVSMESSPDVVQGAFNLGARGYVLKTRAAIDLLAAVKAVLEGRQFVSPGLLGLNCPDATGTLASQFFTQAGSRIAGTENRETSRKHEVQFSSDEASFLDGFARFIEAHLKTGNAVIVIATESHRNSLFLRLQAQGFNIGAALEKGSYIPLDVADTLASFMVNDMPDPVRFLKVADDLLVAVAKAAKGKRPRVAACGECAPFLWGHGNADAAVRLEQLWDEVAKTYDMDILCGYVMQSSQREHESYVYERICAEHSAVCSQ